MTKSELIDLLYEEFEKDKETIKQNLLLYTDNIILNVKNNCYTITLNIRITEGEDYDK